MARHKYIRYDIETGKIQGQGTTGNDLEDLPVKPGCALLEVATLNKAYFTGYKVVDGEVVPNE